MTFRLRREGNEQEPWLSFTAAGVEGEAKNEDGSLVAKAIATVRVRLREKT